MKDKVIRNDRNDREARATKRHRDALEVRLKETEEALARAKAAVEVVETDRVAWRTQCDDAEQREQQLREALSAVSTAPNCWCRHRASAASTGHESACLQVRTVVAASEYVHGDLLTLRDEIAALREQITVKNAQLDIGRGMLRMAVDRLGGIVEGKQTHEGNFLQRIDELRRIEDREAGWSKDYDSLARKLDGAEKEIERLKAGAQ